jgi:cyclophilin family peptidyl-prolyl cis-trans isomerase
MRRNRTSRWSALPYVVVAILLLSSVVGVQAKSQETTTRTQSSGCWTEDQQLDSGGNDVPKQWSAPPAMAIDVDKTYTALIKTNFGDITVEFYPKDAPQTVNNFVCLAREGYYDNTPVHRIINGFVIQGGDPTGTGTGGPGYKFNDEPISKDYVKGTLAMANAGPNTNGSQFFIVLSDLRSRLPKNYTIFGQVTGSFDAVDKIAVVPVTGREPSQPTVPVTIESVTITES